MEIDDPRNWKRKDVVYKWEQVVTVSELYGVCNGFIYSKDHLHWWQFLKKQQLMHSIGAVYTLIKWLEHGKKTTGEVE